MLKFAIVGCGRIAKRHADILSSGEIGAELTAVCDIQEDRAKEFAKKYDVPFFTDYNVMLEESSNNIDVIDVLTQSGNHAQNVIELSKHGKHIVVEKPMALTLEDSDKMIEACNENGSRLFVVKQNRFNYPVQKLREALVAGRFGKLVLGTIRVRWCRTQEYYNQDSWRGTWAEDGGVFSNQASHHVDLLSWMMGEVESVYAKSTNALVDIEADDTGVVVLKFKNGALGVIEATTATRPVDLEGSISILGEGGTVEIGGFAVNKMKVWNFVDKIDEDDDVIKKYSENPPNVYGFGHHAYLKHIVEAIENNDPALVEGAEGRKSLKLIMAIYESIETGKEVFLDSFVPDKCKLGKK